MLCSPEPGKYDLLITDFSMPEMSGFDAAKKFTECNPGVPVILITGLHPEIAKTEMEVAGIIKTLQKPCTIDDLTRAISESLE